ncbi:unnamed protein product [Arctia plantaginis]|uniref:Arrestin C-terminal-like domain-containing protein n=1 Tax=Arctia plantaginis TaxID=874455 RepID=A0A8S0ZZL1_ARCPL|nr:unnamed protein product [Arctia plantaginis]
MGISCQINLFKPPNSVYQPGDVVSGIIKYVLPEQMEFDKIVTSLKGTGLLEVRVSAQNIHTGDENVQSSNETYVDIDHVVTNGKTKVPAGSYDVNFNFTLPQILPSSFLYQNSVKQYRIYCRVKYYVRIKFERPGWFTFSKHFRKEIYVVSGITPKLLMHPIIYGKSKKLLRFFSRKNAFINMKATIQNSIIPIGGQVHIDYEIKNDSNVPISCIETKLVEIYTFKVQGHSKVKACEDVPNTGAKIGRIDCGILKPLAIDMNVPIDRATLQNSKVIKRDYVVRTKVTLPMPHRNIVLDIPVEIGPINNFMPRNIPNR